MPRQMRFEPTDSVRGTGAFFGDLLIFVDETGDEALGDPASPLFGYGACAVTYDEYAGMIEEPWTALKKKHLSAGEVFHAVKHLKTSALRRSVERFFEQRRFLTLGAAVTPTTVITGGNNVHGAATDGFIQLLRDGIGRFGMFSRAVLMAESSERGDPKLDNHTTGMGIRMAVRNVLGQTTVYDKPVKRFFASKSAAIAGLEVADAIAHAAAAQTGQVRNLV